MIISHPRNSGKKLISNYGKSTLPNIGESKTCKIFVSTVVFKFKNKYNFFFLWTESTVENW